MARYSRVAWVPCRTTCARAAWQRCKITGSTCVMLTLKWPRAQLSRNSAEENISRCSAETLLTKEIFIARV